MIVVLEGLNGVGKSACAKLLQDQLHAPIVRAFRGGGESTHLGREDSNLQSKFRAIGIPANTFVDDIYTADLLAQIGVNAIMDRSMGSAIAYGMLYGDISSPRRAKQLLSVWERLISGAPGSVLYVYMKARPEVRKQRCKARWQPTKDQTGKLEKWFNLVFRSIDIDKIVVDTSDSPSPEAGVKRIVNQLR